MTELEIKDRLSDIFRKVFKTEIELEDSTSANDIPSWDSLNHVILIKEIEAGFGIEFDLFDVIEMKTVGDMVGYISRAL